MFECFDQSVFECLVCDLMHGAVWCVFLMVCVFVWGLCTRGCVCGLRSIVRCCMVCCLCCVVFVRVEFLVVCMICV